MHGHEMTRGEAADESAATAGPEKAVDRRPGNGTKADELEWHRAETERLRVLVDFLARPIHAPGGVDPDPDVLAAYNLAVEAALKSVRRAASATDPRAPPAVR